MKRGLAALLAIFAASCATIPAPAARLFPPPNGAQEARALAAWQEALRRAESLPPSRLLYDAKFGKGPAKAPGTLAVVVHRDSLTAKATGPLGGELGSYENWALSGNDGEACLLEPGLLRAILAGVWGGAAPSVAGADAEQALLRWETDGGLAEGVLDLPGARLTSLRVRTPKAEVSAEFEGARDPWPEVISLYDITSGRSLKLRRVAVEPLEE